MHTWKVLPVYLAKLSEEDSCIKTIKIFSSSSRNDHTQWNSTADSSSLLCEMLVSSTCRNFCIT
jgi:hypothetical protein